MLHCSNIFLVLRTLRPCDSLPFTSMWCVSGGVDRSDWRSADPKGKRTTITCNNSWCPKTMVQYPVGGFQKRCCNTYTRMPRSPSGTIINWFTWPYTLRVTLVARSAPRRRLFRPWKFFNICCRGREAALDIVYNYITIRKNSKSYNYILTITR